jgi:tubulin beta
MQAGHCGNQMGTESWGVVCDEHGNGGGGEFFGDNDAQRGRINEFNHGASGGECTPLTMLMDLEPGMIDAVNLSCRSARFSALETSCT